MKNLRLLPVAAGVALASASFSSLSAGFQVNEHSANGLGRAFAGQAATPENASILATNAGAITAFDKTEMSFAVNYINPNVDIEGEMTVDMGGTPVTADASEKDIAESALIPSFFVVTPINDKVSVGAGLFANYGLSTDYSDTYNALHFADRAEVITFTFNPTVAYKLTDTLSIGLGLSATYAEAEIGTSTPQAIYGLTGGAVPGNATILKLEGDDWGFGWNLGALWQATADTTVALSYRAKTELSLDGEVSSDMVEALNQPGSLDLDLAAIAEFAVNQKLDDQWSLQFSANFTEWSVFEKLEANLSSGTDLLLKEEHFENTWRVSVGTTYLLNEQVTLRAGYAYDEGAVTTAHRSLSIPDTDRHWVSVGGTYKLDDAISFDLGYAYLVGSDAVVERENDISVSGLGTISSTLSAEQSANAHIFSAQVNYRF